MGEHSDVFSEDGTGTVRVSLRWIRARLVEKALGLPQTTMPTCGEKDWGWTDDPLFWCRVHLRQAKECQDETTGATLTCGLEDWTWGPSIYKRGQSTHWCRVHNRPVSAECTQSLATEEAPPSEIASTTTGSPSDAPDSPTPATTP